VARRAVLDAGNPEDEQVHALRVGVHGLVDALELNVPGAQIDRAGAGVDPIAAPARRYLQALSSGQQRR
jgi:hypothetical protein